MNWLIRKTEIDDYDNINTLLLADSHDYHSTYPFLFSENPSSIIPFEVYKNQIENENAYLVT